jgi:hypothetical protein
MGYIQDPLDILLGKGSAGILNNEQNMGLGKSQPMFAQIIVTGCLHSVTDILDQKSDSVLRHTVSIL